MEKTLGAGCRWLKKLAQRAAAGGDSTAALAFIEDWEQCKDR